MSVQLWTAAQAVEFFHARGLTDINIKWMRNRFDKGDIPYTLVNRKRRVRSDIIERVYGDWIKSAT